MMHSKTYHCPPMTAAQQRRAFIGHARRMMTERPPVAPRVVETVLMIGAVLMLAGVAGWVAASIGTRLDGLADIVAMVGAGR